MPISALPTPPSRSDAPQDFSDRADALLGALPGFVTEANALQSDVNAKEASVSSYATIATDKAAEAQGHATTASTKASEAAASAVAAAAAASNAEIAFDSFDDKYLGSKSADPATDNDGNPLLTGALYWNTTVGAVRVWNGSAWLSMAADASIVDFQQAGAGSVVRTAQDKMREWVSVGDFGVVGDGIADDTEKVRAAHTYANSIGASVTYRGVSQVALQAGAAISVQTDVDFSGCQLILLGGVQDPLAYAGGFFETFIVADPGCPFEAVAGTFTGSDLYAGSLHPTRGVFDGHGYALLTCTGFTVPNRDETGTQAYTQAFNVIRNGKCTLPLSVDLSANAATCSVKVRRASAKRLRIDGVVLPEGAWNKQRLFKVQRCNVDFGRIVMRYTTQAGTPNICDIIFVENAADVTFAGIDSTGMQYSGISGTYVLNISGGADIRIRDVVAVDGWGWIGTNNVNGMYVENCHVNRIDGHSGLHNVFVSGGSLSDLGVCYGWGGGTIKVKGAKIFGRGAIFARNDYGGCFFGSLDVEGVDACAADLSDLCLVNLAFNGVGASSTVYLPSSISVRGAKFRASKGIDTVADIIDIAVTAGSAQIYAPDRVVVSDIEVEGALTPRITIPWGDLRRRTGSTSNSMTISGVASQYAVELSVPEPVLTPVNPSVLDIDIASVSRLSATINFESRYIFVRGGVVEKFVTAGNPYLQISDALLRNFGAPTKIGGSQSTTERWTGLHNCTIIGDFDLSTVSVLRALIVGATTPTLPAGVTRAIAFAGWTSFAL